MIFSQAFSENFTGLELEDGGGRGTSGNTHKYDHHNISYVYSKNLCVYVCACVRTSVLIHK